MLKVFFFVAAMVMVQCDTDVEKAFRSTEIVPDMISVAPKDELRIEYLNSSLKIHLGNEVKPSQVGVRPDIIYSGGADLYYTFLMTDLDAPSRENHTLREILHCVIGNILSDDIQNGEVYAEYLAPAPPQGYGLHRYVFLLFQQEGTISVDPEEVSSRVQFSTRNFINKHNLGVPVAGNFFVAQNENN